VPESSFAATLADTLLVQVSAFPEASTSAAERRVAVLEVLAALGPGAVATTEFGTAFWVGPGRWWVVPSEMQRSFARDIPTDLATVVGLPGAQRVLYLRGPHCRDILAKGCGIDFDPAVFPPGRCVVTRLARTTALLHARSDDGFDIYVPRSLADWLLHWIEDAALEFRS